MACGVETMNLKEAAALLQLRPTILSDMILQEMEQGLDPVPKWYLVKKGKKKNCYRFFKEAMLVKFGLKKATTEDVQSN